MKKIYEKLVRLFEISRRGEYMKCPNCGNPALEQESETQYYCTRCRQNVLVRPKEKKEMKKQDFSLFIDSIVRLKTEQGTGTGFFVSKSGLVITNAHVLKDEIFAYGTIGNSDEQIELEVLYDGIENELDLCLLQMVDPRGKLVPMTLSDKEPKLGESVYAIGNPKNIGLSISKGTISRTSEELYQLDLMLNTGNSGGPVIDEDGKVIGVVSFAITDLQGISFAIPSKVVKNFIKKEMLEE